MKKYRRIEVNAFHRRVTVVSGDWRPGDLLGAQPAQTEACVSLNDGDECEAVKPDSPEGQRILVDAIRTLERRLTPDARALIGVNQTTLALNGSNRSGFFRKLESFYQLIHQKLCALPDREN